MKREEISEAVGNISPRHVQEAYSNWPRINSYKHRKFSIKRMIALVATLVLCFAIAIPVLAAADVDLAYDILYAVSPQTAQGLKPVRMACEDNGIRMEVIAADFRDNKAQILISMQDLAGDRIDETTDLFDSYTINQPFPGNATCELVGFNDETTTSEFMIHITNAEDKDIVGKKITFKIDKFLSDKKEFHDVLPLINLSDVPLSPQTQTNVRIRGLSNEAEALKEDPFLVPDPEKSFSPVNGVTITATGFINQRLHIQAYYENILETDNHGYLELMDAEGNMIRCLGSMSFWDSEKKGSYEEYIFDVSPDEISEYKAYGNFWTCDTLVTGDWQVTFPIDMQLSFDY
jgi:hypothetical protein